MRILVNKIRCNKCGQEIESTSTHDFKWCRCNSVAIDGGLDYLRRIAKSKNDYTELSIIVNEYDN